MSRTCLAAADNAAECKRIVMQLPHYHRNAFVYLIAFLREVLRHSSNNDLSAQDLGTCRVRLLPVCARDSLVLKSCPLAAVVFGNEIFARLSPCVALSARTTGRSRRPAASRYIYLVFRSRACMVVTVVLLFVVVCGFA